jgi:hypothetical protein
VDKKNFWRLCSSCKKPIGAKEKYYFCGISTCRKSIYCSVPCFDDHTPIFRHKDAWAEERIAPMAYEENSSEHGKIITARLVPSVSPTQVEVESLQDVLVVASKLKDYIKTKSGMSTSASVFKRLSDMIRLQCDKAMERAKSDSRKTVLDRDFYL